jgi:Redoxin
MPHCPAVGNHFFDETFHRPVTSSMGVKTLLFLLCATALLAPVRAAEMLAPEEVAARLAAKENGPVSATVLIFLARDCPISNALVPEMNRIVNDYKARGVAFFLVYAERDLADKDAARHALEFALAAPVTVDRAGVLTARAGVKVTPEAALLARSGAVVYRGRINDLFAGYSQKRPEPTSHDLRRALDAVLAGKAPPVATTPAIGCYISTKP